MRHFFIMIFFLFITSFAQDLKAPLSFRLLSDEHALFDTIEVTTYLQNVGDDTAWSPLYPDDYANISVIQVEVET